MMLMVLMIKVIFGDLRRTLFQASEVYPEDDALAVFSAYRSLNLKFHVKLELAALRILEILEILEIPPRSRNMNAVSVYGDISAMVAAICRAVQSRALGTPDNDSTTATISYDRWLHQAYSDYHDGLDLAHKISSAIHPNG